VAADEEALELTAAAPDDGTLDDWIARRTAGEPLAWITGRAEFCGIGVGVDSGVYVPRWQSEPLARKAAELLPADGTAVDLCTGSGAVALVLSAARPRALVLATETHPVAVANARRNGVDVREGHLFDPLPDDLAGAVDVVVAVAPYVPTSAMHLLPRDVLAFEPRSALDGGQDGLEVVAEVVGASLWWIRQGGWLLMEVGGDQIEPTSDLFQSAGYDRLSVLTDGDGDRRAVIGCRRGSGVEGRPV
jgi:release factor glutamine methyltransferase